MEGFPYFPMFVDLSVRNIKVIGGGKIAARRTKVLTDFCPNIMVIAPEINDEICMLADEGKINTEKRTFRSCDLVNTDILFAATDDVELNRWICTQAHEKGIIVNNCSDRSQCDFFFPGIALQEGFVIGVTANGNNHQLAKQITECVKKFAEEYAEEK